MDFTTPPEVARLCQELQAFLEEKAFPLETRLITEGFSAVQWELDALRREAKTRGWWLPQLPERHGGMGLSLMAFARVGEVLGQSPIGHYLLNCQAPDAGNMELLAGHATPEQRQQFLQPLLQGTIRSCFAMTEPGRAGSNPTWLETRAEDMGGEWVVDGHKWFTSAAEGATFAIVMAVTEPEDAPPHQRASMIIVPLDTMGYHRVRNISVMGDVGSGWASHAEVRFSECRVPGSHLVGQRGAGFRLAQERLGPGRIHHCMRWIGVSERAFDLMVQRAATRELKPGQMLGEQQQVRRWIADSRAEIDAARLLVLHAAWKMEREGQKAARAEISAIKFHVSNVMQQVLDRAIQVHGALGMTDDTPLAWFWRHERAARIYDGPDEVHREVVAREALKALKKG